MQHNDIVRGLQHLQRAQQLQAAGLAAEAAAQYNLALRHMPGQDAVLVPFSKLAEGSGDWSAVLRLEQLRAEAGHEDPARLARALFQLGRYEDALGNFRRAAAANPDDTTLPGNAAVCLLKLGRWSEATDLLARMHDRDSSAETATKYLTAALYAGRQRDLERLSMQLPQRYPQRADMLSVIAEHRLRARRWREGFALYGHRWTVRSDKDPAAALPCPRWDGQPFDGVLLVCAEQGLGDEILFSSMFDELQALQPACRISCDARLLPVFRRSFPRLDFVARTSDIRDGIDMARARATCAGDLCQWLRRQDSDFPARHGWLHADPERQARLHARYQAQFSGQRTCGLGWRSKRAEFGADKSIPPAQLAALGTRDDLALVSLQYDADATDAAEFAALGMSLHIDPGIDTYNDIDGLFAQVAALDHVICSSNSSAHIAGALGIPTDVLLPDASGLLWYWGYAGHDMPWYPSVRVRRCPRDGDWSAALALALQDLPPAGQAWPGRP